MEDNSSPFHIGGVVPDLAVFADQLPIRTESGIGALMPWAGKLWVVSYLSNRKASGGGTGLFSIDSDFRLVKHPESLSGCFANRMMHGPSNQIIIGPHLIDTEGVVRTVPELRDWRLTATMEHLEHPERMVYILAMEGKLWEVDVYTLESKLLFDLVEELRISTKVMPHFKGGYTAQDRVVVANNTYQEADFLGDADDGRLAEWDGRCWHIVDRAPFNEVAGRRNEGDTIYASGWDRSSAVLRMCVSGAWRKYRLPKASHTHDHYWQTEWPRIREVEHERLLMDLHGMFYELQPYAFGGCNWGILPVARHLRVVPDFCSWRGLLVLGGNQATPTRDTYLLAGEPQAGLWFGKTDDLWQFGPPQGWGGPWWDEVVTAGQASDPYLMTGFNRKCVHLSVSSPESAEIAVEVDFTGLDEWHEYARIAVQDYAHHEFPDGFSAHWVRARALDDCTATVQFHYT